MKKIILLVVMMLFLTGCSVEYNLRINQNLTYNDSIVVRNIPEGFNDRNRLVVEIASLEEANEIPAELYSFAPVAEEGDYHIFGASRNTLENYANNPVISQLYGNVRVRSSGTAYRIEWSDFNQDFFDIDNPVREITMNLSIPFRVLNHNFDRIAQGMHTTTIRANRFQEPLFIEFDTSTDRAGNPVVDQDSPVGRIIFIVVAIILLGVLYFAYTKFIASKRPQYTIKY